MELGAFQEGGVELLVIGLCWMRLISGSQLLLPDVEKCQPHRRIESINSQFARSHSTCAVWRPSIPNTVEASPRLPNVRFDDSDSTASRQSSIGFFVEK